ncbi:NUDIX domain-containing protein [candidate division WWE3 bacterium]|uniref:NUDIX domain-containing protein n=1 Tax=candidate division WWE3 bacterium TaxID=2053526 RepID=A0A955LLK2_UNCKA|nr:NUDIX domain-containing protein [candidate division WWE3 bacterium]
MTVNIETTDNQNELLTQVDEDNKVIGEISRGRAHETYGVYYRTIYALVVNREGKVLVQKRSVTKDLYPNCWDLSVGGHVNYGDSYVETAVRELFEELGIYANDSELFLKGQVLVRLPKSNEYFSVFEYSLKEDQKVSVAKEEVGDVVWMTVEEIKSSMEERSMEWYERPIQVIEALY